MILAARPDGVKPVSSAVPLLLTTDGVLTLAKPRRRRESIRGNDKEGRTSVPRS